MSTGPVTLALRAGPLAEADLWVTRVEGREWLSEPYAFVVDVWPLDGEPFDCEAVLGREALLTLRRAGGEERLVHGEVHAAALVSIAAGVPTYRITIAPRLARLALGARSRVFQELSIPEIVDEVLSERGISHRLDLAGSYPARPMTLQHREPDLAFVSRLLEGEGIWYRFEHSEDGHELVLADGPGAYVQSTGAVPYRPDGERGGGTAHVYRLARASSLVPAAAAARDRDFERPALDLAARATEGDGPEVYEWPGGYVAAGEGKRLVATRLEELRYGAETFEGRGTSHAVAPGAVLEVEEFPPLLPVAVVHRGEQEKSATGEPTASYENAFEAIDAGRPYRPRRSTPPPRMAGIQTATVVGPAGEEVHTDRHERVKVQFHWDREGKRDERSSAWVRVAEAWAGAGMGATFVPRLGQEVVIRFLEGDPDRPVVVGAVYNGANVPPAELPREKTRSTVRTSSSPGSDGFNELRFEDEAGREEVHLHAQRDRDVVVLADEARAVRANAALAVERDREKRVLGSQELEVAGADSRATGGNETVTVVAARTVDVAGAHEERVGAVQALTVAGAQAVTVGAASAVFVGAAAALNVGGGYAVNVGGAVNEIVAGMKSSQVGGASSELVGAHREERVAGDRVSTTQGGAAIDVDGGVRLGADGDVTETVAGKVTIQLADVAGTEPAEGTLGASAALKLVVGGNVVLAMTSGGEVKLAGQAITLDGSQLTLKGGKLQKVSPASAEGASAAQRELGDLAGHFADVEVVDLGGNPVPAERYVVRRTDGTTKEGRLGGDGRARVFVDAESGCKLEFPDFEEPAGDGGAGGSAGGAERSGATRVKAGKAYDLRGGAQHAFQLPVPRNVLTVTFFVGSPPEGDYPRLVLESDDGSYRAERSPKDDLVQGDEYLQLCFGGLAPGRRYTLTAHLDAEASQRVFGDVGYEQLVDQHRPAAAPLQDAAYARFGGGATEQIESTEEAREER